MDELGVLVLTYEPRNTKIMHWRVVLERSQSLATDPSQPLTELLHAAYHRCRISRGTGPYLTGDGLRLETMVEFVAMSMQASCLQPRDSGVSSERQIKCQWSPRALPSYVIGSMEYLRRTNNASRYQAVGTVLHFSCSDH